MDGLQGPRGARFGLTEKDFESVQAQIKSLGQDMKDELKWTDRWVMLLIGAVSSFI